MTSEPHRTGTTAGLSALSPRLEQVAERLGVKSVLVMRSEPDSMVVAATAGAGTEHYAVGGAGKKAGDDQSRVPLYCERIVDTAESLFVRDSRQDPTFAGNEDEVEFGMHNYLGLPVHDPAGNVVGTVCVLDDAARDYSEEQRGELEKLRSDVESAISADPSALG
jgi:signal transduction protein with GAF and PtsI domain